MKHIKLFESFGSSFKLEVGDIVFIKPTEREATFVAVDPIQAREIEEYIMSYDFSYEGKPIKLMVTDPTKNYVIWDVMKERARLVGESEAYTLNQTGDYIGLFLKDGKLDWEEPNVANPMDEMNPKYIIPVVKDRIVFIDGHGSALFIDEPIDEFYGGDI